MAWLNETLFSSGRFLSSSSSNDDDFSTQKQTEQLKNVLYINIVIFIILAVLFELLRHMKAIFLNRYCGKFIKLGRVPPKPSAYPFAWIYTISQVSEDDVLRMIGLDGYMLLRYLTVCFRTASFFTFFGVVILAPVYYSGDYGLEGWGSFTLANIPQGPTNYLWVPVIFAYIFSMFFCQLMYLEYNNFKEKRVDYIVNGDSDTPVQTYYTVLVERLPAPLRSTSALYAFFNRLFPGQVFSVEIAVDLNDLEDLVHHRRLIRNKLEKAIALYKATKQRPLQCVRPSIYIGLDPQSRPTPLTPTENDSLLHKLRIKMANLCGYELHDAIDHFESLLDIFNTNVAQMQRAYFLQRQQTEAEESRLAVLRDKLKKSEQLGSVVQTLGNLHRQGHQILAYSSSKKTHNNILVSSEVKEVSELERGIGENNNNCNDVYEEAEDNSLSSGGKSENSKSLNTTSQKANQALHTGAKLLNTGVENIAREGFETAKVATKGAWKGVQAATRALELLTVGAYYKVSSTGFVTFTTRVAKSSAEQMLLSHEFYKIYVSPAPNPHDILWQNVSLPITQISMRTFISGILFGIGALFWSLVVAFISAISNLESIAQVIPSLQSYSNTEMYNLLNNYLAIGLLLLLLALLPFVFDFVSRSYEGLKQESDIQNSIMTRYFYYSLANVFVAVGLGSIASSLHQIVEDPTSILRILGASVPSFSTYFASLLIIRTCTAVPIEMLRLIPLIDILAVQFCFDKKKCTRRELRAGAFADPPMLYGWIYPNIIMVLMILFTYSCIAPFIAPLAAAYFSLVYLMYKYQLLYVYINNYQSGGFMWYAVFDRSMLALLCGVATLLCYLAIRETYTTGPLYALLPLPIFIAYFWKMCNNRFKAPARSLSLERAQEIDETQQSLLRPNNPDNPKEETPNIINNNNIDEDAVTKRFSHTLFRQPSLAESRLKPAPYRIARHHANNNIIINNNINNSMNDIVHSPISPHFPIVPNNTTANTDLNHAMRMSFASEADRMSLSRYLDPEYDEELQADDFEVEQEVSLFLDDYDIKNNIANNNDNDTNSGDYLNSHKHNRYFVQSEEGVSDVQYAAMKDEGVSPIRHSIQNNNALDEMAEAKVRTNNIKNPVNYGSISNTWPKITKEVQLQTRATIK